MSYTIRPIMIVWREQATTGQTFGCSEAQPGRRCRHHSLLRRVVQKCSATWSISIELSPLLAWPEWRQPRWLSQRCHTRVPPVLTRQAYPSRTSIKQNHDIVRPLHAAHGVASVARLGSPSGRLGLRMDAKGVGHASYHSSISESLSILCNLDDGSKANFSLASCHTTKILFTS